jgi:hypothetical protein
MTTTVPDTTIDDLVTLSQELENEGRIQGQVRLYNVDNPDRTESDPDEFFNRTLLTDGLKKSLSILRDSLSGNDPRGTHLLQGPFGTGKSHQMVALYHCFNAPEIARQHFGDDIQGFGDALPGDAVPVQISLQYRQPDQLWEPLFEELGYDPGSFETGGFPDMSDIEEAADGRTVAFFIDELERWFNTLNDDRQEKAKGFLQALLEAAAENPNIYSFVSILREESEIHGTLNREYMVPIQTRDEVNVRDLIHHRLFESSPKDNDRVKDVVDGYVEAYEESEYVNVSEDIRTRMYETYPFHPQLLDTLQDCYYSQSENQAVRGMLFFLSQVLLIRRDETDLLTHGDLEPGKGEGQINTELNQLDSERREAYADDLGRIVEADIPYGPRILTTILIHSLRPGKIEMVGANTSDIVLGTYRTGDKIPDIVRDLNRVDNGKAWYLHEAGGKYAIQKSRTVSALISDEKATLSKDVADDHIAEAIENVFNGGHAVVNDKDLSNVPDSEDIKVVVKANEWEEEEVRTVITNDNNGRTWRNTLVFVQPTDEVKDSSTVDKAVEIEAARAVGKDRSLDDDLRETAKDRVKREKEELQDRIEIKYGEIVDGDDLLNEFDDAIPRGFDAYDVDADADEIADAMTAGLFNLREVVSDVTLGLLDRKDEATIEEIYEQFLKEPGHPIPEGPEDILSVADELEDEPVLVLGEEGFLDEFRVEAVTDTLVSKGEVDYYQTEDIKKELKQRLHKGDIEFDDFVSEMKSRTDVFLSGDVVAAANKLEEEGECMFVDGREITDSPKRSMLRTDVELVDAEKLRDKLRETIEEEGEVTTRDVLYALPDSAVFDDVEGTAREAVEYLLDESYLIEDGYEDELSGTRNPLSVTIIPTVDDETSSRILERVREMEAGDSFTLVDVAPEAEERKARTFLLKNLGGDDPSYLLDNGSANPRDWGPGTGFRIPGGTWEFVERTDDVQELREEWLEESEDRTGELTDGFLNFVLYEDSTTEEFRDAAEMKEAKIEVRLTPEPGQDYRKVGGILDKMPEDATEIRADFEFEK